MWRGRVIVAACAVCVGWGCTPSKKPEAPRATPEAPQPTPAPGALRPPAPPSEPPTRAETSSVTQAVVIPARVALHRDPSTQSPHVNTPGDRWAFELVGWSADKKWARVRPLPPPKDAPREHCAEGPRLWDVRPTFFVAREALGLVTTRPVLLKHADGTWLALMAGTPLQRAGGEDMISARADDLRTGYIKDAALAEAAGHTYTPTPMRREEMEAHDPHTVVPKAPVRFLSRHQPVKLLGQPARPLFPILATAPPSPTMLGGLAGLSDGLHPSRVVPVQGAPGEVSAIVRTRCATARVQLAATALQPVGTGRLGAVGGLAHTVTLIRPGAAVRWPNGEAVGNRDPKVSLPAPAGLRREDVQGTRGDVCFEVPWSRHPGAIRTTLARDPRALIWCVTPSDVVQQQQPVGLGGLGVIGSGRGVGRPSPSGRLRGHLPH